MFSYENLTSLIEKTIEASRPTEFSYNDLRNMIRESLLKEGGNVFVDDEGGVATIRIVQGDVQGTLEWLEKIVDLPLVGNELGTTGVTATSGDLDIAVDKEHKKSAIEEKLIQWVIGEHPELELDKLPDAQKEYDRWWSINLKEVPRQDREKIKQNRETAKKELRRLNKNKRKWMAKTGVSLHFKTPISGREDKGFVQTDLMFGDPEFMKWAVKGEPEGKYKGLHRQLLIDSIAAARGYAWNSFKGLRHRQTNEEIINKEEIAKVLLGPEHTSKDLESFQRLKEVVEEMDDYEELIVKAVESFPLRTGMEFPKKEEDSDLLEEAKKIEPRIQHAEALIFFEGSRGALDAINVLSRMNDEEGRPETSLKWDGSPAVIFGRDSEGRFIFTDKGGFGVKSYKGKVESEEEMEAMYRARAERASEKSGVPSEKILQTRYSTILPQMQKTFRMLKDSVDEDYRGFFFGEVLYFNTPEIEDGKYSFKPNMVKYKISTDSEMGKKIGGSEVGIVLHFKKDPKTLNNLPLDFDGLTPDPKVLFFGKTFIEKPVEIDEAEIEEIRNLVETNAGAVDGFFNSERLGKLRLKGLANVFYAYLNGKVDTGLENLGGDLIEWVESNPKFSEQQKTNIRNYISENEKAYGVIWEIVSRIMKVKDQTISNIDSQGGLALDQSLGDEEVGEGYVISDEGKLIKLVDRSKFTKANRAVIREQDEGEYEGQETHVFIPGGFKPPHKGHVTLLEKALEEYPNATKIYIVSGGEERGVKGVPDFVITREQSKKIWKIYLNGLGIPEEKVELDYFKEFKRKIKSKTGKPVMAKSPLLKIAMDLEFDTAPNSTIVLVSPFDSHINFIKNAVSWLNKEGEGKRKDYQFKFEPLKVSLLEDPDSPETTPEEDGAPEPEKLSAGNMRKAVAYNKFEDFKRFMPDFIFEEESKKIFAMLGGQDTAAEEAEETPMEPQEAMEEMSSAGGVAGYAGPVGPIRKRKRKRKRRMEETNYIKMKEMLTHEEDILKEYLVEKYVAKLKPLMEQDMSDPKFRLGVNLTSRAFNDIKKNYLEPFAELLVTDEEKMSYMIHILAKLGHVFIQHDINRGIKDIALDQEFTQKLVNKGILTPEIAHEAAAASTAALEERDAKEAEEKVSLEIGDENLVTEPEEKETKEAPIEAPEEILPGMDQTGGNFSNDALTKIKVQLMDDYKLIGAEEGNKVARQAFIEYSYKNLIAVTAAQYAGKVMPEPLNSMYAAIKQTGDIVREPEVPEEIPAEAPGPEAAEAAPEEAPMALEESDIQNIIKQSVIKSFRKLNFS